MMGGKMTDRCQAMMAQKDQMMAEMNAPFATMNSAPENKKQTLLTAVVTHWDLVNGT